MKFVLLILVVIVAASAWENLRCSPGNAPCPIQFKSLHFENTILMAEIVNTAAQKFVGGHLAMETQGHGCVLFFCGWSDGPVLNNETCDWGFCKPGNVLVDPHETRIIQLDFRQALIQAQGTSGCCSKDSNCGCILQGVATFKDEGETKDIANVHMAFNCDLSAKGNPRNCAVTPLPLEEPEIKKAPILSSQ